MKEKLYTLHMFLKHNIIVRIVLWTIVAAAVILLLLSRVPITKSLRCDMQGYIVSADGEILEEFDFAITGKDYNFIIDPPGGEISFSGDQLTVIERDALILYFEWGLDSLNEAYSSGHWVGEPFPDGSNYSCGTLTFYNKQQDYMDFETALIDLVNGTFCMYTEALADHAFLVGTTDPNTDPASLIQPYLDRIRIPELKD